MARLVRVHVDEFDGVRDDWFTVEDMGPYEPGNLRNPPKDERSWLRLANQKAHEEGCAGAELSVGGRFALTILDADEGAAPGTVVSTCQFTVEDDGTWTWVAET